MAIFNWIASAGDFNTAANWDAGSVPGTADTANFSSGTGAISTSGTASVAIVNFNPGGPWSLGGTLTAGQAIVNDNTTVLAGAVLNVTTNSLSVASGANAAGTLTINGTVNLTVPASTTNDAFLVGGGSSSTGANGTVTVSGTGATLNTGNNAAAVGLVGTGTLNVLAGGSATFTTTNSTTLAALSVGRSGAGSVTVSGTGSTLTANGYTYIGRAGTGTLTVDAGGTFVGGSAAAGSTPLANVTIGDGTPNTTNGVANTPLYFGGSGTATVTNSSTLRSLGGLTVGNRGTTGTLLVDTSSSVLSGALVTIGGGTDRTGGTGKVTVQGGGLLQAGGLHTVGTAGIVLGNDAGTSGTVTVTGSGSTLDANGDRLTVGASGTGTLTVSAGARALSGSAGYSDTEAAFAVGTVAGGAGTVTITGSGSQLTATGDAVIGGNEKGAAPTTGGTATVSVLSGGALSISGTTTIQSGGTLTVDGSSTLTAPTITVNGGTANLATLSSATAVGFGTGGTLGVTTVSGANTVGNFTFGDKIDIVGSTAVSVSGNTLTTSTGTIALGTPAANASYQVLSDGNGGMFVALTPKTIGVYRFFDKNFGTHFYTADGNEERTILATRPDLTPEGTGGIGLQAVAVSASDPSASAVYRFFDSVHGTHFFTASATERDQVIATRTDLTYEPNSTFYEHTTAQPGDTAVYRFFDSTYGTHFYTDSASELATIQSSRPDLKAEGIGFYEPPQNYANVTST